VSPALSDVPVRKVLQALRSVGFDHKRTSGSHAVMRHPDGRVAVVPQHGTLSSILRQSGLTPSEFLDLIN
jgi:predicted RNA binding protein YcfA (HicA-like mRNA interferase family)